MLAEERKKHILTKLSAEGAVHVGALAVEMNVSVETIRRDIKELHKQHMLKQVHGGAIPISKSPFRKDPDLQTRKEAELEERQRIARQAVLHLNKGETIAINEGVTSDELAKALPGDYNLTIYTSSISVAYILYQRIHEGSFSGQVCMLGGSINSLKKVINNETAYDLLDRMRFDKVFLAATAVDVNGAMETTYETGKTGEVLVQHSIQRYLLVASSKFGYSSTYCFCPLNEIHYIITDSKHPIQADLREQFEELGGKIEIC